MHIFLVIHARMLIFKFALINGLNVLQRFTETGGTIYNQTNKPGLIQGMSTMFSAEVTPNID